MRSCMKALAMLARLTAVCSQRSGWRHGNWISGKDAPEADRSKWVTRPPMFGRAPEKHKRPISTLAVNATGPWREPVSLGPPLWRSPTHNFSNDVITGLALNYRQNSHRFFVGSVRKAGYRGDVVIITEPLKRMQQSSAAYLRSMGVVAYAIDPDCSTSASGSIKHKTCSWRTGQPALPLAIIRHVCYLAIATLYSSSSNFYVADYRDTFFQRDPFIAIGRRLTGLELLLVAEHWPFKKVGSCPFNGGCTSSISRSVCEHHHCAAGVRNCWGKASLESMREQVVLCSGSYMGAQPAIVNFERILLAEVEESKCHLRGVPTNRRPDYYCTILSTAPRSQVPSDQGYLNYLFYMSKLPRKTLVLSRPCQKNLLLPCQQRPQVEDRGTGVVNTIGSLDGSRPRKQGYLPESHVNIGQYWNIRDEAGYLLQDDKEYGEFRNGTIQYRDRFHLEFGDFVRILGQCDSPSCYSYQPAQ